MAMPIKTYRLGKISGAVFENEYKGKKNYSVKFQKGYKNKEDKWVNTDFFSQADLRELYILVGEIVGRQVVTQGPQRAQAPQEKSFDNTPQGAKKAAQHIDPSIKFSEQEINDEVPF